LNKSPLETQRLNYSVDVFPLLRDIKSAYWKDEGNCIKLLAHEIQHSPALKVGVMFSGGPAPGGLNVLCGLYKGLKEIHPESALIGFLNGAGGFLKNDFLELGEDQIAQLRNQGGFSPLGTGRTKIESLDQMKKALEIVKEHRLQGLVFIGGDDTNTNAYHLSLFFEKENARCMVVGVPKTIDGDLKTKDIEASFGFDTATKTFSHMIGNLCRDAMSAKKYWFFIKLMGRAASHVTLECALKSKPNLAFITEEISANKTPFKKIIEECANIVIQRAQRNKNYGVILIPEGLIEGCFDMKEMIDQCNRLKREGKDLSHLQGPSQELFNSLPLHIQKQFETDVDPHGNMQLSHIATDQLLAEMVQERVKNHERVQFKVVPIFYGYDARCALPSNFDATYCYNLGLIASLLVRDRKNGYIASVKGLNDPVGEWSGFGIPIQTMMHQEERNGEIKSVIAKALVDLKGRPFKEFSKKRDQWKYEDMYESTGPIQFDDSSSSFVKTLTLVLEQTKKSFL